MSAETMDAVFEALASPVRRRMLDILKAEPGCSVKDMTAHFDISRIGVMKHLSVLRDAGLLTSEKEGRTRRLYLKAVPIQMIHDRWTSEFSALWAGSLTRLKYKLEGRRGSGGATRGKKGRRRDG